MLKLDFEKADEPEIKLPTSDGSSKKQESSRKTSTALMTMPKPLTVWIAINCGKFLKRWEPDHLTCPLRNLYAGQEATVRTRHETTDWFQIGKRGSQGCILSPCFSSVQFSHSVVSNSATPWTAAHQTSLSITNSGSLLKLMSIKSVMPSNHLILCLPLLLRLSIFPSIRVFAN